MIEGWLWAIGEQVCHLNPDRCFWIGGFQMPLCCRCFSICLGITFTTLVLFRTIMLDNRRKGICLTFSALVVLVCVGLGAMTLDGITQALGLRESSNWLRIATGSMFGISFVMLVVSAATFSRSEITTISAMDAVFWLWRGIFNVWVAIGLMYLFEQSAIMYALTLVAHTGSFVALALGLYATMVGIAEIWKGRGNNV